MIQFIADIFSQLATTGGLVMFAIAIIIIVALITIIGILTAKPDKQPSDLHKAMAYTNITNNLRNH